jgi:threonine/homoserine/homoserine lactone efflux protein
VVANLLNPHPYLFWMTVGAPLMQAAGNIDLTFVIPFYLGLVGVKVAMALGAGGLRGRLAGRGYRLLNRVLALALAVLAVTLLRDGVLLWYR